MLGKIEERLKDVMQKLEQSLANHNALLGAKMTLEALYKDFKEMEPNHESVIDGALSEIDHVMTQVNGQ